MKKKTHNQVNIICSEINSILHKTVKLFPEIWLSKIPERHIYVALKKIIETGERSPERLIEAVKRSYLCNDEGWNIDGGEE